MEDKMTCTKCGETKAKELFTKCRESKSGYRPICKTCKNIQIKISRNSIGRNLYYNRGESKKKLLPLWASVISRSIRRRNKNKWGFKETNSRLLVSIYEKQGGLCYYSKMPMNTDINDKSLYKISVDRLDSSLPYTDDNIVLCTVGMNYCKNSSTVEEFTQFLQDLKQAL